MIAFKDIYIVERLNTIGEYYFYRQNPQDRLKKWTQTDIDRFCKEDPVHGNQVKALRGAGVVTAVGGLAGGAAGGAFTFSRGGTLNGSLITGAIGGISSLFISALMAQQVSVFTHGLYKFDKYETTKAFRDWWRKNGGAS
mmetsp:Transcript_37145/g.91431  ORF Transcript_37145/g.91431 Transcript_37145/m.91431 type:complete len:140 (+) Transcript_37145:121-540(+)